MARGRMLNNTVSASLQFDQLPDDTCRLLATWIIAHLDVNGVFFADPPLVRSRIFSRRTDITIEQIEGYLKAMEDVGLIWRYYAKGEMWQYWPAFKKNQPGLRTDRETPAHPPPPASAPRPSPQDAIYEPKECPQDDGNAADDGRQDDGNAADDGRQAADEMPAEGKLSEAKSSLREVKGTPCATAPPPPSPPEPVPKTNTRKPTKANLVKAELEAYFSEVTALPKPARGTKKQRTQAAQLWWNPLQQIAKQCEDDVDSAKRLIDWTIAKMDQEGWNISSPNSILKTAKAEQARRKRGGVARNDGRTTTHQVDRNAEIINRAKERRRRANGDVQ